MYHLFLSQTVEDTFISKLMLRPTTETEKLEGPYLCEASYNGDVHVAQAYGVAFHRQVISEYQ